MGYVLLWIESLIAAVLWMAAGVAMANGFSGRFARATTRLLAVGVPVGIGLMMTGGSAWLTWGARLETSMFPASLAWMIAVFVAIPFVAARVRANENGRENGWFGRRSGGAVAPLGIAALVAGGLTGLTFLTLDGQMRAQMAMLRAEATALTLSVPQPAVPDADNAAPRYSQITELFEALAVKDAELMEYIETLLAPENALDPADARLRDYLADHDEIIVMARAAGELPAYRAELGIVRPLQMAVPDILTFVHTTKLLRLHARMNLAQAADHEGKGEAPQAAECRRQAAENVRTLFRIAGHLTQSSTLIGHIVAQFAHETACRTLGETLSALVASAATDSDAATAALSRLELPALGFSEHFRRVLLMEEAFGMAAFASIDDTNMATAIWPDMTVDSPFAMSYIVGSAVWRVFVMPADLAQYQTIMAHHQSAAQSGYPMRKRNFDRLRELEDRLGHTGGVLLSGMMLPALVHFQDKVAANDAAHRIAHIAVAAAQHHIAHGQWPATLAQLRQTTGVRTTITLDPYTGEPLKFAHHGDAPSTLVIYSVGANFHDNGGASDELGKPHSESSPDTADDIALTLTAK